MDKDLNRHTHNKWMIAMFVLTVVGTLVLAGFGKVTNEYNLALGALLGFMGNHTYQHYRTTPSKDEE